MATCIIPDCDEEVRYYHLNVCAACYSGLTRWRGRSVTEKRHRLQINHRLVSRMDFIMDHPKHHARYAKDLKRASRKRR
jgi:hypothetical protein